MKLNSIVFAAALLTSAAGAMAADYVAPTVALEGSAPHWSTSFGTTHTVGAFTDTFTFTYSGVTAGGDGFFGNVQNKVSNIDFTSATLNGVALDVYNFGIASGSYFSEVPVNGLLTLVISGKATGNGVSSYSGTLDVTSAVPEPTTYGMLLGGMGVMAFLARRRKA